MIGFVLAAGEGKRLRPLSRERPKALIPTLDRPQAAWAAHSLLNAGVSRLIVNAHFFPDQISLFGRIFRERYDVDLQLSIEPNMPFGTAGALRHVADQLTETIVVHNADIACEASIAKLVMAHESSGATATLLVAPSETAADVILEEGWVRGLVDRRERNQPGYVYGGIGAFDPSVLELIPEGECGLYETVFSSLVANNSPVAAFEWDGYWLDISDPRSHHRANIEAIAGVRDSLNIPRVEDEPTLNEKNLYVGARVTIDDVELRHCVIGTDSQIAPGSKLERCVVWSGARVKEGSYKDAIITQKRVVTL